MNINFFFLFRHRFIDVWNIATFGCFNLSESNDRSNSQLSCGLAKQYSRVKKKKQIDLKMVYENSEVKLLNNKSLQDTDLISMEIKNGQEVDQEENLFGDKKWVNFKRTAKILFFKLLIIIWKKKSLKIISDFQRSEKKQ